MHQRGPCSLPVPRWETEARKRKQLACGAPAVGVRARCALLAEALQVLCSPGRSSPSAAPALPPSLPLLPSEVERETYFFLLLVSSPSFLLFYLFRFCLAVETGAC